MSMQMILIHTNVWKYLLRKISFTPYCVFLSRNPNFYPFLAANKPLICVLTQGVILLFNVLPKAKHVVITFTILLQGFNKRMGKRLKLVTSCDYEK
jgi:hypothetical protein